MRLRLGLIVLLGFLSGCSTSSTPLHPPAGWVAQQGGLGPAREFDRVQAIAQRFEDVVQRPFRVHLLQNDTPTALAWPSGDLYLTTGLARLLHEHEIAAVIGHELGHLLADGHNNTRASLTGSHDHHHSEMLADDQALIILQTASTPPTALRSALQKVLSYHELRGNTPRQLAARIARLP